MSKLNELVKELQKIPYGNVEHMSLLEEIKSKLQKNKKWNEQWVLTTPSSLSKDNTLFKDKKNKISEGLNKSKIFSSKINFIEDNNFIFKRRSDVEYDLGFKQINVFGLLTDGKNFIGLKSDKCKTIKMVGGHVDFSMNAYRKDQISFLKESLDIEILEELKVNFRYKIENMIGCINTNKFNNDLHHVGVVFLVKVEDDLSQIKLKSGEPDKFDVEIFNMKNKPKNLHHWYKMVIEEYEKKNYTEKLSNKEIKEEYTKHIKHMREAAYRYTAFLMTKYKVNFRLNINTDIVESKDGYKFRNEYKTLDIYLWEIFKKAKLNNIDFITLMNEVIKDVVLGKNA